MATRYFFEPAEFALPSLAVLKGRWRFVPDADVRSAIAAEHQYLHFQEFLLNRLRYRTSRGAVGAFGLSARAGAVKAAILLYGSIIEAALRSHAETRGYVQQGKRMMFGQVLPVWKEKAGGELDDVWADIHLIHRRRNTVHLHQAAADEDAQFKALLTREHEILSAGRRALARLQTVQSEPRPYVAPAKVQTAPAKGKGAAARAARTRADPAAPPAAGDTPPSAPPTAEPPPSPRAAERVAPAQPAAPEAPADAAYVPAEALEQWLNENVYSADPGEYAAVLMAWVERVPYLDTAGWNRLHPRVELDRRRLESELWEREAEQRYQEYLRQVEELARNPEALQALEEQELSWEDELATERFSDPDAFAAEEEDEDNPDWYSLDEEGDDDYGDEGDYGEDDRW
jgi:hypothetical protein